MRKFKTGFHFHIEICDVSFEVIINSIDARFALITVFHIGIRTNRKLILSFSYMKLDSDVDTGRKTFAFMGRQRHFKRRDNEDILQG